MKISKVIYLLFSGGILAIVAILIAFYQPNLIEEKDAAPARTNNNRNRPRVRKKNQEIDVKTRTAASN